MGKVKFGIYILLQIFWQTFTEIIQSSSPQKGEEAETLKKCPQNWCFIVVAFVLSLLSHLKISIDLQWWGKKVTIGLNCNLNTNILTKRLRNVHWVFLYQTYYIFKTAKFDWLSWQPKGLICENIFKTHLLRRHKYLISDFYKGDKAETLQNVRS